MNPYDPNGRTAPMCGRSITRVSTLTIGELYKRSTSLKNTLRDGSDIRCVVGVDVCLVDCVHKDKTTIWWKVLVLISFVLFVGLEVITNGL